MDKFEQEIAVLQQSPVNEIKVLLQGIELCNKVLAELKVQIEREDFTNLEEEIAFFKEIKPRVMAYLLYFMAVRSCERNKPRAGDSFQIRFLEKELKKANKFFYRNADFLDYMELGHTHLDHQLFTRSYRNDLSFSPLSTPYQFPSFSTSHDMLWSRMKGMNLYIQYLQRALEEFRPGRNPATAQKKHRVLVWTASKTSLIELIYALYSDQAINHGGADLNAITCAFEDFFNIRLDNVYKTYAEIKGRKGSKTKFLEELMLNLHQKMYREDSI